MPLSFLSRLQRVQLPVSVTDPEEIRKVTVLIATGLIEAEFNVVRSHEVRDANPVPTVTRITEDGLAELATADASRSFARPLIRFSGGLRLM
ncbi:hypothetical protein ABID97_001958 [Variovorax sp. OAS795]|uniref:hypothetical protein n=1 Tax=Variovorax sp. OAS795 TaxID=3034231 RepID=UPI003396172F